MNASLRACLLWCSLALTFAIVRVGNAQEPPANSPSPATPSPRSDANGNPLRRAPTGHVSNYDEAWGASR